MRVTVTCVKVCGALTLLTASFGVVCLSLAGSSNGTSATTTATANGESFTTNTTSSTSSAAGLTLIHERNSPTHTYTSNANLPSNFLCDGSVSIRLVKASASRALCDTHDTCAVDVRECNTSVSPKINQPPTCSRVENDVILDYGAPDNNSTCVRPLACNNSNMIIDKHREFVHARSTLDVTSFHRPDLSTCTGNFSSYLNNLLITKPDSFISSFVASNESIPTTTLMASFESSHHCSERLPTESNQHFLPSNHPLLLEALPASPKTRTISSQDTCSAPDIEILTEIPEASNFPARQLVASASVSEFSARVSEQAAHVAKLTAHLKSRESDRLTTIDYDTLV